MSITCPSMRQWHKGVPLSSRGPVATGFAVLAFCVVGFGEYRDGLMRLADALGAGDLADARDVAARGRELEGAGARPTPLTRLHRP